MNTSMSWIKRYVPDLDVTPKEYCDAMTLSGTKVETCTYLDKDLDKIVVGRVLTCEPHPDADHLHVCKVDVGSGEPLQIVCGAQNFEQGDHVVVAMIGAVLPGGFEIKKSKLRGVESCGMCCSNRELGLSNDHSGIIVLPEDAPLGVDYAEYRGLSDTVIDCEMTPTVPTASP